MSETNPDIAWALKILERNEDCELNLIHKHIYPLVFTVAGFLLPVIGNYAFRRPYWAGFQNHIVASIGGFAIGIAVKKHRVQYFSEKEAILRDYIILHPEDFQEPERKKWGEVFVTWLPRR